MYFPNGLNFEADKPVHVSVFAPLAALSQVYSDDFPTKPTADDRYVENPGAIELARQIYTHLFESISLESMRPLICHAIYLTQEKRSDQLPLDQTVWDAYIITFDHLVAAGDKDPEVVQLYVDEDDDMVINDIWVKWSACDNEYGRFASFILLLCPPLAPSSQIQSGSLSAGPHQCSRVSRAEGLDRQ